MPILKFYRVVSKNPKLEAPYVCVALVCR